MKTLEFFYQETEIHFLLNPTDKNVMVNATEMAKIFNRRTKDYLKTQSTKEYIKALERALNGARSDSKIVDNRGHVGIYFERRLALDFAAWLDVEFRVWVFSTIDEIVFGNYKSHWNAHVEQERAQALMNEIRPRLLTEPTVEDVREYFEAERTVKASKNAKRRAIDNQYKMNL